MHIALCCFACVCVCILVWHAKSMQHCGIGLQEITQRNHNPLPVNSCAQHAPTPTQGIQGHGSKQSVAQLQLPVGVARARNKQPTGHALLGCTCHTQFASFQLENTLTVPTHLPSLPPLFSSFSLSLALFSGNVRLHLFSKLQIFNQLQGVIFALQTSFTHFHRFN